jgi:hypothetical protein
MKRAVILVLGVVALACGGGEDVGAPTGGIRGQALAGPQCPVEVEGSPCPDLPWDGTVVATDVTTDETFTAKTDGEGRFELSLAPGTYDVSILVESSPPFAKPQTVTVEAGSFTEIVVVVDTGIR